MDNGQVTVDAHAGKEQYGAIHVAIEEHRGGSAHDLSKYPVVPVEVVSYLKWQCHTKKKICNSQVGVEDGQTVGFGPEEEFPQGHTVDWHTNHKHQDINGRYQLST
jgi:hypothetical protein